jgi:hypothetical protein
LSSCHLIKTGLVTFSSSSWINQTPVPEGEPGELCMHLPPFCTKKTNDRGERTRSTPLSLPSRTNWSWMEEIEGMCPLSPPRPIGPWGERVRELGCVLALPYRTNWSWSEGSKRMFYVLLLLVEEWCA